MFSERRCAAVILRVFIILYSLFFQSKKQGFGPAFLLFLMVPYCDTDRFIV